MNPIALLLGGGAAAYGVFQAFRKPKRTDFQTQQVISPTGLPVKVVTPIPRSVTQAQRTGTVMTAPVPGPIKTLAVPQTLKAGQPTIFAPAKSITQTAPGQFEPPSIIVTPTGASSVAISSTMDVQRALNTLGFQPRLVEDGKLGPKTIANIKQFQSKNGLVVDGNAGPATKSKLSSAVSGLASGGKPAYSPLSQTELGPYDTSVNKAPRPVVTKPYAPTKPVYSTKSQTELGPYDTAANRATTTSVNTPAEVQAALNRLGANPPLQVDGQIGPKSVAAIKSFQMSHGLAADGVAGPKTRSALAAAIGGTAMAGDPDDDFACGIEYAGDGLS